MADFEKPGRTKVVRKPDRGRYDHATVYAILDEAPICRVGIVEDGRPVVIPPRPLARRRPAVCARLAGQPPPQGHG